MPLDQIERQGQRIGPSEREADARPSRHVERGEGVEPVGHPAVDRHARPGSLDHLAERREGLLRQGLGADRAGRFLHLSHRTA
jgi:hypothetical protein